MNVAKISTLGQKLDKNDVEILKNELEPSGYYLSNMKLAFKGNKRKVSCNADIYILYCCPKPGTG